MGIVRTTGYHPSQRINKSPKAASLYNRNQEGPRNEDEGRGLLLAKEDANHKRKKHGVSKWSGKGYQTEGCKYPTMGTGLAVGK